MKSIVQLAHAPQVQPIYGTDHPAGDVVSDKVSDLVMKQGDNGQIPSNQGIHTAIGLQAAFYIRFKHGFMQNVDFLPFIGMVFSTRNSGMILVQIFDDVR